MTGLKMVASLSLKRSGPFSPKGKQALRSASRMNIPSFSVVLMVSPLNLRGVYNNRVFQGNFLYLLLGKVVAVRFPTFVKF